MDITNRQGTFTECEAMAGRLAVALLAPLVPPTIVSGPPLQEGCEGMRGDGPERGHDRSRPGTAGELLHPEGTCSVGGRYERLLYMDRRVHGSERRSPRYAKSPEPDLKCFHRTLPKIHPQCAHEGQT